MKGFFLFIFSFFSLVFWGQEISFETKLSRKQIGENENIRVDFTMNQNGDNFTPPNFEGFSIIMGPSQSISQSIINGKQSFSKTYSFTLSPKRKGTLNIGIASVEINGKIYKTKPISVEVTDAVKNPKNVQNTTGGFSSFFGNFLEEDFPFEEIQHNTDVKKDDIFLVAEISKTSPYLNEPVSVTYKILFSNNVGIRNFRVSKTPEYPSFYKEEIPIKEQTISQTQYKGRNYRSIPISKVVLYPQKTGQIIINPLEGIIDLEVVIGQHFFGNQIGTVSKQLSSGNHFINVKELPLEGRPENFSGAVGNFSIKTNIDKNNVRTGETISPKIILSGKGNFNLIEIPKLNFPDSFETYDPEKKETLQSLPSGISGHITTSYTVIPQYKGEFSIPPIEFSFFNPETKKYITITTKPLSVTVKQGKHISQGQSVKFASEQFMYLKTNTKFNSSIRKSFFDYSFFWIVWLLPLFGIPTGIWGWNRYQIHKGDIQGNRLRLANRLAKKYLSSAKKSLHNKNEFYENLERCLHNYLKSKLHIETSELSKERIKETLQQKQVEFLVIEQTLLLFSNCEKARYAPYTQTDIEKDYNKASKIISLLDKQIR